MKMLGVKQQQRQQWHQNELVLDDEPDITLTTIVLCCLL
jgi:hypothetical protein